MKRSTLLLVIFAFVAAACGNDGLEVVTETDDPPAEEPEAEPEVDEEPAADQEEEEPPAEDEEFEPQIGTVGDAEAEQLCVDVFDAWVAGDGGALLGLASPEATDSLNARNPQGAALRSSGQDCFVLAINPETDGELDQVGEVDIISFNGSPQAASITWTAAADVTDFSQIDAAPLVRGGGGETDGEAAAPESSFEPNPDDPAYVDLLLDCVYGENEAGSCEELAAAGLSPDDGYGLGNSLTQAPDVFLREDCLNGLTLSCAELNHRVQNVVANGADEPTLLCLFYSAIFGGVGTDLDYFQTDVLLDADAPPGVIAGLDALEADPADADALVSVDGYLGPICAPYLD